MSGILVKFNKYWLVATLLVSACSPVVANALEVDRKTKNLIISSINLELVHNRSLRDPYDNLPLGISYSQIAVFGISVVRDLDTASVVFTYSVVAPFKTVGGDEGALLCMASIKEFQGRQSAERASCTINSVVDLSNDSDEDGGLLIDEY